MPACQACLELGVTCSREKYQKGPICMRCLRKRTRCVLPDDEHTPVVPQRRIRKDDYRQRVDRYNAMGGELSQQILIALRATSDIKKILISLDPGSSYLKAGFKVFKNREDCNPRIGVDRHILPGVKVVIWPNHEMWAESQIAYEWWTDEHNGQFSYRQLWGHEVTAALDERRIKPENVFRWLKPALYGEEGTHSHRSRIEKQIEQLPGPIQDSGRRASMPGTMHKLTYLTLFSDLMGHAWRWVLAKIKDQHPDLPWPESSNVDNYREFNPDGLTSVELVIPVPAESKPHHVSLIVQAARLANMPTPHPVAEPAAAFALDLQREIEAHGPLVQPSCTIVVDIGGGSVDVQAHSVVQTNPLTVREEVEGVDRWCGGSRVNQVCRNLIQHGCEPTMPDLLGALAESGRPMQQHQFLDEAEWRFEFKKREWAPGRGLLLSFPGLPAIPWSDLRQDFIHLSKDIIQTAFDSSVDPIIEMITGIIQRFHERYPSGQDGTQTSIGEILLVGGGSASAYLRDRIRNEFSSGNTQRSKYPIAVRMADDNGVVAATCIAQGALLLMLDRAFISERVIRRGYCVKLDEQSRPGDRSNPLFKVIRDPHDGVESRIDVTRFLIRIGERIGHHHRVTGPRGCWRGLFLDEKREDGWILEERIFYSDTFSQDGVWIDHPSRDNIQPCGMLKVTLTDDDCKGFELRVSPVRRRRYLYLEYQVALVIKGIEMTYQIVIPRSGKFSCKGPRGYGKDPIRKAAHLDCSGVFQLFNAV